MADIFLNLGKYFPNSAYFLPNSRLYLILTADPFFAEK